MIFQGKNRTREMRLQDFEVDLPSVRLLTCFYPSFTRLSVARSVTLGSTLGISSMWSPLGSHFQMRIVALQFIQLSKVMFLCALYK